MGDSVLVDLEEFVEEARTLAFRTNSKAEKKAGLERLEEIADATLASGLSSLAAQMYKELAHVYKQQEFESLKYYVASEGRVCPQPRQWAKFWQNFKLIQSHAGKEQPPNELKPLILNGWVASDSEKQRRLRSQLEYINEQGRIDWAVRQLLKLERSDWLIS